MPAEIQNALANETSPYLIAHANNPVNWYPWSDEAIVCAREHDKPILLSIGYSACHWCHVMAHESFEDNDTARLMNSLYVNIKVDREERPDLDKIYQSAHQLMTRRPGGWPLTMMLTPDNHTPFFAGTYFPREARYAMPGFKEVLIQVEQWFRQNRQQLIEHHNELVHALHSTESSPGDDTALDPTPLHGARERLEALFDSELGGFGSAPKFPHPTNINRLLRHHAQNPNDQQALHMARFTLKKMAEGGIYDQVGGGFCRYSVDDRWMIPHFEKMLYDNGPLLELYTNAYQITADPMFRQVAIGTAEFVIRELQSSAGGFYSTLDADSEGEEGKYYVWSLDEVRCVVDEHVFAALAARFGLDQPPNFEGKYWHLHAHATLEDIARQCSMTKAQAEKLIDRGLCALFQAREQRVRPSLDDKILTSWNGLTIKAMAVAADALNEPRYLHSAQQAVCFLSRNMWQDGRLLATHKDGKSHLNAYLDDYALLASGLLELLQCRFDSHQLLMLIQLCDSMLVHFEDREAGGFFFTSHDHETLLHRPKPFGDDSLPAGNGVAALVLQRVGHLLGESRFIGAAERCLQAGWNFASRWPHAHNALLDALEEYLAPTQTVLIRGENPQELERWRRRARQSYAPGRIVLAIDSTEDTLPGLLQTRHPGSSTRAYICHGHACDAPIDTFAQFEAALRATQTG